MPPSLRAQLEGKRFGLVLSAGFFGFFGHAGFVAGLLSQGLVPAAWSGTSAGGLIAALHAAGMSPERVRALLLAVKREDFWDPDPLGAAADLVRGGHRSGGLLKGQKFRALLERDLPRRTFDGCAPLVLVATDLTASAPLVMDSGDLATAIVATCAYPGLFAPQRRDGQLLWDGGIVDKAPALALARHPAARGLDGLLLHFLPSRESPGEPAGVGAWPKGLAKGMAILRREHLQLQLEAARARLPVHVVTSELTEVGPRALHLGPSAYDEGYAAALRALEAPADLEPRGAA
ncbi:MAG: patatin-like phospholipase family protein [Myxococcaceae bacterium]|nr:patatin-like phospholipase family protein [Myxococcaceae bacterium]